MAAAAMGALEPWEDRPNIEPSAALYMASYPQIRDLLRELPETVRSVLVIGHNPGIHELAQWLAGGGGAANGKAGPVTPELARLADAYPTAALTEFLIVTAWRKIGPAGAVLQRFIQPADLPAATRNKA